MIHKLPRALLDVSLQINRFAKEALRLLTHMSLPVDTATSTEKRYAPLLDFMLSHLRLLSKWLPLDAVKLGSQMLWDHFVWVSGAGVCTYVWPCLFGYTRKTL